MLDKIIRYSFYILFFATPLFWTKYNFELFEFNKMIFVYFFTVVIIGAWAIKCLTTREITFKKTPLDIPLGLFLLANILSTVFSIDRHTSIWGYYSRSNGGLLSTISYICLYYALISNLNKEQTWRLLKIILAGGLAVALYAIPEHFGVSPSCVILQHEFIAGCWVQDVQARVFATLGQPNWLACLMVMLIPLAIYFFFTAKTVTSKAYYLLLISLFYLTLTFTYSQSGLFGFFAAEVVLMVGLLIFRIRPSGFVYSGLIMAGSLMILINLIHGSALGRFNLGNYIHLGKTTSSQVLLGNNQPAIPEIPAPPAGTTALETGGTDSGKIRLIVWTGSFDVFKHYPILGSGVETFAYSYYLYRPLAHNFVSEWDFLYNKAHNEFLNYLATIGILGFGSFLLILGVLALNTLAFLRSSKGPEEKMLKISVLASICGFLVVNFFGFSVVSVALLFYGLLAISFNLLDESTSIDLNKNARVNSILKHGLLQPGLILATITISLILGFKVLTIWYADTRFAKGENYSDGGYPTTAYQFLDEASRLRPDEPFYRSELGFAAAASAVVASDQDATLSGQLKEKAAYETAQALAISPNNPSFYKTAARTFFALTTIDPSYEALTKSALERSIALSPTDPKTYYNKALILGQLGHTDQAIEDLKKAVLLKPDYREGHLTLGDDYKELGKRDLARQEYEIVLKLIPGDVEALDKIKALK